jgi:hypothetical protein
LALDRLAEVFGIMPPDWETALAPELDQLVK